MAGTKSTPARSPRNKKIRNTKSTPDFEEALVIGTNEAALIPSKVNRHLKPGDDFNKVKGIKSDDTLFKKIRALIYRESNSFIIFNNAQLIDERGRVLSDEPVRVRIDITTADALALRYVQEMHSNDHFLFDFIDRETGKPGFATPEEGDNEFEIEIT